MSSRIPPTTSATPVGEPLENNQNPLPVVTGQFQGSIVTRATNAARTFANRAMQTGALAASALGSMGTRIARVFANEAPVVPMNHPEGPADGADVDQNISERVDLRALLNSVPLTTHFLNTLITQAESMLHAQSSQTVTQRLENTRSPAEMDAILAPLLGGDYENPQSRNLSRAITAARTALTTLEQAAATYDSNRSTLEAGRNNMMQDAFRGMLQGRVIQSLGVLRRAADESRVQINNLQAIVAPVAQATATGNSAIPVARRLPLRNVPVPAVSGNLPVARPVQQGPLYSVLNR